MAPTRRSVSAMMMWLFLASSSPPRPSDSRPNAPVQKSRTAKSPPTQSSSSSSSSQSYNTIAVGAALTRAPGFSTKRKSAFFERCFFCSKLLLYSLLKRQRDIFEGKIPLKMQRSNLDSSSYLSLSFSLKRARASSREEQTTLFPFFVSRALRVRSSLAVIDRSRSEETERKRKKSVSLLCGVLSSRKKKAEKKKFWHTTQKDLYVLNNGKQRNNTVANS